MSGTEPEGGGGFTHPPPCTHMVDVGPVVLKPCSAPRRQLHLWQRQSTAFILVFFWKAENFPSVDLKALFTAAFTASAPPAALQQQDEPAVLQA